MSALNITEAVEAANIATGMMLDPYHLDAIVTLLDQAHGRAVLIAALVKAGIIEQPFDSTWDEEPPILLWWDNNPDYLEIQWREQGQVTESMTALYRAAPDA